MTHPLSDDGRYRAGAAKNTIRDGGSTAYTVSTALLTLLKLLTLFTQLQSQMAIIPIVWPILSSGEKVDGATGYPFDCYDYQSTRRATKLKNDKSKAIFGASCHMNNIYYDFAGLNADGDTPIMVLMILCLHTF